jgi:hypothetical protein
MPVESGGTAPANSVQHHLMSPDEFRHLLLLQNDQQMLGPCLRDDDVPFAFDTKPENWPAFRDHLSSNLSVRSEDIRVVGSARLGFSLKPGRKLRPFSDTSDVDVVVVSATLFDELWQKLLLAAYPRDQMLGRLGGWLANRQREVYTGWITPKDVILSITIAGARARAVLTFRWHWFHTFKKASALLPRRHEDVNARLYRTWEHVDLYHLMSLAALRRTL